MSRMVTLTIDGKQVTVPEGTLVVDAARKAGIDIPVFCYHPKMEPAGMCRMCLVEIGRPMLDRNTGKPVLDENGQPKLQFLGKLETACTNVVSEGMVVLTQSEKARAGQKATVEFLLTSHPLDCPICDKGGECPLQDLTMAYGPAQSRFLYEDKIHLAKHLPLGELIYLDRERCILCSRCIRFQSDIAGDAVLSFDERGRSSQIITVSNPPFDSVFSGNTTDICPVGALTTADFRFGARPWELKSAASICAQCPVGCNIVYNTRREARSDGRIVIKRVLPRQNEQVNELWVCDKGRFAYHYTESPSRLATPRLGNKASSWTEALEKAAIALRTWQKKAILVSGRISNEDLYALKRLADHLQAPAYLYTPMGGGEWVTRYGLSEGSDLSQIGPGDAILVIGSDLYEEAPIWYLRVKEAARRGAKLILAMPRFTRLERFAHYTLRYAYGDEAQIVERLRQDATIGKAFQEAGNLVIFFGSEGMGLEQTEALAAACAQLLSESGHSGRVNNGLIGVWPRPNDQGAWELGFRPVKDLQALFDELDVLYLVAADPIGDGLVRLNTRKPYLIVQEILETETVRQADVVFPACAYTEREGTFTSGERRVQRYWPAVPHWGECRPDFAITGSLAELLGLKLETQSAARLFQELASSVEAFRGLDYARLSATHPQWPPTGKENYPFSGTAQPNTQGMGKILSAAAGASGTATGQKVWPEALRPEEGKLLLVPITRLFDAGSLVTPSSLLHQRIGVPCLILHPGTAQREGVQEGDEVLIAWEGQEFQAKVVLDETAPSGVGLVPRSMGIPLQQAAYAHLYLPERMR
uniref:NADH-quinone oxidoreductase n=1 Tax=uncultured Chloroflexota bacterium TaxID=166587 RepID=H5S8R4_9CHLR|nr:NADH dehydrogenase I subunit G [uncultured Chloroflexota bacterium]